MADTLEIFGVEYTNVAGIIATTPNETDLTYIRPQGTKSISANGTGIDVAAYASVDVDVSGSLDMPTFTIVWNDAWDTVISTSCDKTYQECRDYCNNGVGYANLHECDQSLTSEYDNLAICIIMNNTCLKYIEYYGNIKDSIYLDISYDIHGDLIVSYPSTILETKNVTQNGTVVASDDKILGSVVVNVPSSTPTLQNKTVSPSELQQSIQADSGYDGLDTVTVNAISSTYVGTGITRRSSSDLTASGATVTVPSGYYSEQASKAIASGTQGTPSFNRSTGTNSVTLTPVVVNSAGYINGGTRNGEAVTISASELVSGTLLLTDNGTADCTNYANVNVNIPFVTYYTGSSTPASSLGSNGDIYLKVVS